MREKKDSALTVASGEFVAALRYRCHGPGYGKVKTNA
jgi:hypothetical protein